MVRGMAKAALAALAAWAVAGAFAAPATAADLGGNCCADLEERIAALEAETGRSVLTVSAIVNGQPKYVVIDPTSFALEDNSLRYIGTSINNTLNQALNGSLSMTSNAPGGAMNLGAGPLGAVNDPGPLGTPHMAPSGVWAAALGGTAKFDGNGLTRTDNDFAGGIAGVQLRLTPQILGGAFAGGVTNTLETDSGKTIDTEYFMGGAYGRATFGPVFLDASLSGGRSNIDSRRQIVSTVPGTPKFQTALGSYDGDFFLPVLRLGASVPIGGGAVLVPAVQVRYIWQQFDGYNEGGSSVNLTVGDRTLENFEERIELGVRQTFGAASGINVTLNAAVGAVLYQRSGDGNVSLGLFGSTASLDPGSSNHDEGIYGRAGILAGLTPGVDLFGDGEVSRSDDVTAFTGSGGIRVRF